MVQCGDAASLQHVKAIADVMGKGKDGAQGGLVLVLQQAGNKGGELA